MAGCTRSRQARELSDAVPHPPWSKIGLLQATAERYGSTRPTSKVGQRRSAVPCSARVSPGRADTRFSHKRTFPNTIRPSRTFRAKLAEPPKRTFVQVEGGGCTTTADQCELESGAIAA